MVITEIRIPKTEDDYRHLVKKAEELMTVAEPGTEKGDEYELILLLLEQYEEKHFPIPSADPIDIIKYKMEQLDLKAIDLVPFIGHKSTVSRILNGERELTLDMIRNLSKGLKIPIELLIKS